MSWRCDIFLNVLQKAHFVHLFFWHVPQHGSANMVYIMNLKRQNFHPTDIFCTVLPPGGQQKHHPPARRFISALNLFEFKPYEWNYCIPSTFSVYIFTLHNTHIEWLQGFTMTDYLFRIHTFGIFWSSCDRKKFDWHFCLIASQVRLEIPLRSFRTFAGNEQDFSRQACDSLSG